MEVNRDSKKSPTPFKVEDAAPWLTGMLQAGGEEEAPDQNAIDAIKALAIAGNK